MNLLTDDVTGQTKQKKRGTGVMPIPLFSYSSLTSGRPAMLISKDRMPANADAEPTAIQFTSPSTAEVPIVAIAVCAIVLIARTPAALIQVLQFFIVLHPFIVQILLKENLTKQKQVPK